MMAQKPKIYRSKAYMKFVDSLSCAVETSWGVFPPRYKGGEMCSGLVTHHHTEPGGTSLKGPDLSCIPLCHGHHEGLTTAIHRGKETFAKIYGLDVEKEVLKANQAYIEYLENK